jgi:hypothetical protein
LRRSECEQASPNPPETQISSAVLVGLLSVAAANAIVMGSACAAHYLAISGFEAFALSAGLIVPLWVHSVWRIVKRKPLPTPEAHTVVNLTLHQ